MSFLPADTATRVDIPEAEAARATAIGAAGPGFMFLEPLEEGPTPVAGALSLFCTWLETFDELRRLRLAAIDMELATDAARALSDEHWPGRRWQRVFETGLVVTYARPYARGNGNGVGPEWAPEDPDDARLHRRLIEDLRNPYHAHADRTTSRTLIDTAAMLGFDEPPTFAEGWQPAATP